MARYIPSIIPEADLAMFQKARFGGRSKLGTVPAVLVVDMTRGFVSDEFPCGCTRTGEPATQNIKVLLDVARAQRVPVFYTKGFPRINPTEAGAWEELKTPKPAQDLMQTEEAHTIVPLLQPQPGEVVITKAKPSGFFGSQLLSMLIFNKIDTLIITGMTTSGCVRATVVDAFSYNYKIIVPIECVADRGDISHEISLFDMDQKYANVQSLAETIAYLEQLSDTNSESKA